MMRRCLTLKTQMPTLAEVVAVVLVAIATAAAVTPKPASVFYWKRLSSLCVAGRFGRFQQKFTKSIL